MAAQKTRAMITPRQQLSSWNQAMAFAPDCFRPLLLAPGESLWREGDLANSVAMVLSGKLSLKKRLNESNSQLVLGICGAESIIGEAGLLEGRIREETAMAMETSLVAIISRENFQRLSSDHADVAQSFMLEMLGSVQDRLVGAVSRLTTLF